MQYDIYVVKEKGKTHSVRLVPAGVQASAVLKAIKKYNGPYGPKNITVAKITEKEAEESRAARSLIELQISALRKEYDKYVDLTYSRVLEV